MAGQRVLLLGLLQLTVSTCQAVFEHSIKWDDRRERFFLLLLLEGGRRENGRARDNAVYTMMSRFHLVREKQGSIEEEGEKKPSFVFISSGQQVQNSLCRLFNPYFSLSWSDRYGANNLKNQLMGRLVCCTPFRDQLNYMADYKTLWSRYKLFCRIEKKNNTSAPLSSPRINSWPKQRYVPCSRPGCWCIIFLFTAFLLTAIQRTLSALPKDPVLSRWSLSFFFFFKMRRHTTKIGDIFSSSFRRAFQYPVWPYATDDWKKEDLG